MINYSYPFKNVKEWEKFWSCFDDVKTINIIEVKSNAVINNKFCIARLYYITGKFVKKLLIISSPSKPLKTRENIDAPINIINTKELILTVVIAAPEIFFKFNSFLNKANKAAPAAPTDADSVGVAIPINIEPRTDKIKKMGGMTSKIAVLIFSD